MSLVIVSAAAFEVKPLTAALVERRVDFEHLVCGVGAINAAKNSASLAVKSQNKDVIFVGTCGSFEKFKALELVTTTKVIWSPTGERVGAGYRVKNTDAPFTLKKSPPWLKGLPSKTVACSPIISLVKDYPKGEQASQLVENLELYSCVSELEKASRSLAVILCITNELGPSAHAQWQENASGAADLTCAYISKKLFTD